MDEEVIGIHNLDTGVGSAGVGFVVIPTDVKDREQYVNDCFRTHTVTINGGRGYGFFSGVNVSPEVMQNIKFPTDELNRGTPVVWVKDSISQLPVIIATLRRQSDFYIIGENQFRIARETENTSVEVFIDGNESSLSVNVIGDENNPANVDIKLSSKNKDSVFNLSCDNELNVSSEKTVNITSNKKAVLQITDKGETKGKLSYELGKGFEIISEQSVKTVIRDEDDNEKMISSYAIGEGFKYKDEFENELNCKDGEINVISKKINHNSGKEPMVLGNTLKGLLNDTITAITKLTVPTALGPSGVPINIAEFQQIAAKLDTVLSNKSNLE